MLFLFLPSWHFSGLLVVRTTVSGELLETYWASGHSFPDGQNPVKKFWQILRPFICRLLQSGPSGQKPLSYQGHTPTFVIGSICRYKHSSTFWQYPCLLKNQPVH